MMKSPHCVIFFSKQFQDRYQMRFNKIVHLFIVDMSESLKKTLRWMHVIKHKWVSEHSLHLQCKLTNLESSCEFWMTIGRISSLLSCSQSCSTAQLSGFDNGMDWSTKYPINCIILVLNTVFPHFLRGFRSKNNPQKGNPQNRITVLMFFGC